MSRAFIGVGSNIDPDNNVRLALQLLATRVHVLGISTVYQTEPLGAREQNPFYNCVVELETDLPPEQLLVSVLRKVEEQLGRIRTADKYAPRTIDLDLLLYGELVMNTAHLTLPDPDIMRRPFLAIPLYELAPELLLPGSKIPIKEVAEKLSQEKMMALRNYTICLRENIDYGT